MIYITGANGFVGSHLYPKLIAMGYDVEKEITFNSPKINDTIIHLAAKTSIGLDFNPHLIESNIIYTKRVFQYPSRIIFASSCSAKHLTNPYAYTKRYGEYLSDAHGNSISLRFHNIYGNGGTRGIVKFLIDAPDGKSINVRGPELERDYIHVDDVCNEIIKHISSAETGVHDVGSGKGTQTIELVNLYMNLSGKKFEITQSEAGCQEPKSMISEIATPCMTLEEGLLKTINNN